MRKERRFRLMINVFQGKMLARFVAYWFIYQITLWNFLFLWQLMAEGKGNPLEQYARFFSAHYPMLICFAIVVPFFAWDAMKFSHRVAGPIYRLQQTIRAVAADDPIRRVKLRNGDYLLEVADDVNDMLESLEERGVLTIDRSTGRTKPVETATPDKSAASDASHDESLSSHLA